MRLYIGDNRVSATYYGNSDIKRTIFYQEGGEEGTVTGAPPLSLPVALPNSIWSLTQQGVCEQDGTPTPDAPVDIVCNNGALRLVDAGLPSRYKRLSGLSLSSARFVTHIYLNGASTLRFSASGGSGNWIGAYHSPDDDDNFSFYATTMTGSKYLRYDGGRYDSSIQANVRYDIEITPTGVTGNRVPSTWEQKDFTCSIPLCIGATSPTGTTAASVTFYGSIYADDIELIPCERKSDGVLGYYGDGTFYAVVNDGTVTSLGYDTTHLIVKSVGTPEVLNVTANIFTRDDYLDAYCASDGKITEHNTSRVFIVPCEPNTEYRLIFDNTGISSPRCVVMGFVAQPEIGMTSSQTCYSSPNTEAKLHDVTFTTEGDIHYLVLWLAYSKADYSTIKAVAKTILYKTVTAQIVSVVDLLAVDDYKDEQEIIGGAVTRKVGVKVLDGTESWGATDFSQYNRVYVSISNSATAATVRSLPALCSHFANLHNQEPISSVIAGQFYVSSKSNQYYFHISQSSLDEFKAWLATQYAAGTPIIVVYPLAESTNETITPQELYTAEGKNTIAVVSNVSDVSISSTYLTVHSDE